MIFESEGRRDPNKNLTPAATSSELVSTVQLAVKRSFQMANKFKWFFLSNTAILVFKGPGCINDKKLRSLALNIGTARLAMSHQVICFLPY